MARADQPGKGTGHRAQPKEPALIARYLNRPPIPVLFRYDVCVDDFGNEVGLHHDFDLLHRAFTWYRDGIAA